MKREVVVPLTATTAVVTPIEASFPLVVGLAFVVGFATGYCVVEEEYTCQSSRYRLGSMTWSIYGRTGATLHDKVSESLSFWVKGTCRCGTYDMLNWS